MQDILKDTFRENKGEKETHGGGHGRKSILEKRCSIAEGVHFEATVAHGWPMPEQRKLWKDCSPLRTHVGEEEQQEARSTRGKKLKSKDRQNLYTVTPTSCVTQHLIKVNRRDWVLQRIKQEKLRLGKWGEKTNCSRPWESGRCFPKCVFNCCLW